MADHLPRRIAVFVTLFSGPGAAALIYAARVCLGGVVCGIFGGGRGGFVLEPDKARDHLGAGLASVEMLACIVTAEGAVGPFLARSFIGDTPDRQEDSELIALGGARRGERPEAGQGDRDADRAALHLPRRPAAMLLPIGLFRRDHAQPGREAQGPDLWLRLAQEETAETLGLGKAQVVFERSIRLWPGIDPGVIKMAQVEPDHRADPGDGQRDAAPGPRGPVGWCEIAPAPIRPGGRGWVEPFGPIPRGVGRGRPRHQDEKGERRDDDCRNRAEDQSDDKRGAKKPPRQGPGRQVRIMGPAEGRAEVRQHEREVQQGPGGSQQVEIGRDLQQIPQQRTSAPVAQKERGCDAKERQKS